MSIERVVEAPKGVSLSMDGKLLAVKGPKGELKRQFSNRKIKVKVEANKVTLSSEESRRKTKAVLGTWAALIKNMALGVATGWKCELKLVFSHFPAKMIYKDGEFTVQNFLGERSARIVKLSSAVNVKIDKENVILTGIDKEMVGMAAGRVERVTRIVGFDRRIFQDGIFITKPTYLME